MKYFKYLLISTKNGLKNNFDLKTWISKTDLNTNFVKNFEK